MSEHTPGRLESKTHTYGIADTGDYDSIFEIWGGEKVIAWFGGEDTDEANARRLVACWNACDGITDPENVVPRLLALNERVPDLEHQAATLRVQRDELLSALEACVAHGIFGSDKYHIRQKARAAIAKVEGGAA